MSVQEYSKRLGEISDEQLQAALKSLDLGDFVSAEPIPFGLFGQNLFLTSTSGEFVLRGCPHYDWQFPTEEFFVNLLHEKTRVPVPYPYRLNSSDEIFGWPFVIMPRMPGLQLADSSVKADLSREDRRNIARALAAALIEMQTLTWEFSGRYDIETRHVKPMDQEYRRWIVQRMRELTAQAQSHNNNTTDVDVAWVEMIIERTAHACATPYRPCLVHEDYKEPNIVLMKSENGWQVSGVFDFMTSHFGDGEVDLARSVGSYLREMPELADEFVHHYLQHKEDVQPGFAERQQLYMLYDSLLIWAFWQGYAGGLPEDKTLTLKQWASPFISYWENIKHELPSK